MTHSHLPQRLIACALIALLLAAPIAAHAAPANQASGADVLTPIDFSTSPYKHLNNGGLTADPVLPYNIDAITGATVTVEGPAVVTSIPLSMRELENRTDGLNRGVYADQNGPFRYEGLDLYYLLHGMTSGDNGILLTGSAYAVVLKNCNRAEIARFTLDDIARAHEDGRPILLAYGIGTADGQTVAPFVFDAANPDARSEGYIDALQNDDGCLKLVYDLEAYGDNPGYAQYANVAYVYVIEETAPGFKHTGQAESIYGASRYVDYLYTFRGSALGREMTFPLKWLEDLVAYDDAGQIAPGGVGYRAEYSLANNAYWYVNEYEGLDLYQLLRYLGMEDAENMGLKAARTTLVEFVAADGVQSSERFSVDTLSYPDAFGFYVKNAADQNDGAYKPTNADLVDTGYPVLLAYGVNRYPYTLAKGDAGYLSGLSNSGGPIRVVFGKTQYNHANGSHQVQYLKDVLVGDDVPYNTHQYTPDAARRALADNVLSITVRGADGQEIMRRAMTVGEIEDLIYGADVPANTRKAAQVKDSYQVPEGDAFRTDIYEGVSLNYLLMEALGLPGTNGTATLSSDAQSLTVNLDALSRPGFNTELERDGLAPILAFAKNGAPLVENAGAPGYEADVPLNPHLALEPDRYRVDNAGGPLAILLPSTGLKDCDAKAVLHVTDIAIDLIPDAYAHLNAPYDAIAASTVHFTGEGLEREAEYSVGDIESRQTQAQTLDFSVLDAEGNLTERRFRGVSLYALLLEIGVKSNAGDVTVTGRDGAAVTLPLSLIRRQTHQNLLSPDKPALTALLAFGAGAVGGDTLSGAPLTMTDQDAGYDAALQNSGGPVKLIVPQESADSVNAPLCIEDVASISVSVNEIDTWGHQLSDIYGEFLDAPFTLTVKNDDSEWSHTFTVGQLEGMTDLILREKYTVLDVGTCEGLDLWKLVKRFAGNVPGIGDPVSVTVYASDGYKNDLLSVFYLDGLELGVPDEDGERKPLLLAYAFNGCPLVDDESHEGYTGLAGNTSGPLRIVAEGNQGASVKYATKLVVTVPGAGAPDEYINHSALEVLP